MVGGRAPAGRGGSGGEAVCRGAWKTLTGGDGVMEARGEAPTAVHHRALLGEFLQDAASPGRGRA